MATRKISELRFRPDEEGQLKDTMVILTPHYAHAVAFYAGMDCWAYSGWQKKRGKPVGVKVEKYERLLKSLQKKGLRRKIDVRGDEIQHGHHRAAAWLALGHEEIECREV